MFCDKVLPTDSFIRTWMSGLQGTTSDSLGQALLLPIDVEHYSGSQNDLKLKWHNIVVSILSFSYPMLFSPPPPPLFLFKCYFLVYTNFLIIFVIILGRPVDSHCGQSVEGCHKGS